MSKLLLFNKPYGVLSQFTDNDGHPGLKNYISESNVYPAGRLDHDSEGLLILTNDGALQARITEPKNKMVKTYWAQVEGAIDSAALHHLCRGIVLKDGPATALSASTINPSHLWERNPPIRERKNQPVSWIEIKLAEGRNRQVRRMTAAVGHPTLRLIRVAIGPWSLDDLKPGEQRLEHIHLPRTDNQNSSRKSAHDKLNSSARRPYRAVRTSKNANVSQKAGPSKGRKTKR